MNSSSVSNMSLPSVAVTVPTWRRGQMFKDCVLSLLNQTYAGHIEVMCVCDYDNPDKDLAIAHDLQVHATAGGFAGLRSVRIKRGPGRSNWRPGAIHFPVFEHWLQTKCDLITYQFSDELSAHTRFEKQVEVMSRTRLRWSYLEAVTVINGLGNETGQRVYKFNRGLIPTNQLMTPSILVGRQDFFAVGGLDFPVHVAAKAEEWIQTHCAILGEPAVVTDRPGLYYFREHEESLGHGQGPGSETYKQSINETGWVEEDHWKLWNKINSIYEYRVRDARSR